jgi:hypothetical protein
VTAWSTPLDMTAAVMENIQQDPQASKIMIGVGPAMDVVKNAPINLFSNIPHYEFEANDSVRSNLPGTAN